MTKAHKEAAGVPDSAEPDAGPDEGAPYELTIDAKFSHSSAKALSIDDFTLIKVRDSCQNDFGVAVSTNSETKNIWFNT